ncbi:heterokaryon incompatibility protein-domain-containing protein [Hypoxylon sp. FL0890]|nr:heterokaryon incompatibility protein-domain-containing protein [Hypoxylon sp. FL0890]
MDVASNSIQAIKLIKCITCGRDVSDSWANIISPRTGELPVGYVREWQKNSELVCTLCKLIASVIDDANLQFGFAWEKSASLRLLPRKQHTLLGLKLESDPHARVKVGDIDSIFIYHGTRRSVSSGLCSHKKIPRNTNSVACFGTIRQWLNDCKENHHCCRTPGEAQLPTRVLYLGGRTPRLVEHQTVKAEYVAITHCWGKEPFLQTKTSNLQSHKERILLRAMPKNFRDAVYVSKSLGYKYLWIDSLCIIQDDEQDWDQESKLMGDIYNRADLVIAATCASAAQDGFLAKNRPTYRESKVSVALQDADRPTTFYYRLASPHRNQQGPLDKRAWAFQERLLARRYVSFRLHEVTWYCQTSMHCECDSAEVADDHRKFRERSLDFLFSRNSQRDLHIRWRQDIVSFYTQRALTRSSDKLIALSAVASAFQVKLGSKYLVGLWEHELILDLLWTTKRPSRREPYEAPTWSWVACEGWVYYPISNYNIIQAAAFVSSNVSSTTSGPLIPQSGYIVLFGKLVQATLTHDLSKVVPSHGGPFAIEIFGTGELFSFAVNPDIFPPTPNCRSSCSKDLGFSEWHQGELEGQPYPVWVFFMAYYREHVYVYGLILTRSREHDPSYQRAGLVIFCLSDQNDDIERILDRWDNQQVTIF